MGIVLGVLLASAYIRFAPTFPSLLDFYRHPLLCAAALAAAVLAFAAAVITHVAIHRQNQWAHEMLTAFLDHIPDNVFFKDRQSRFVLISRSMAGFFGLSDPSQAVGKTDHDMFSSEHADQALADEQKILRTGQPIVGLEEKETWPDGRETWALTTKIPLKDRRGHIVGTMGISHNINDRRRAEAQIQHMALHDALTGLPNRVFLKDFLTQAIANAQLTGAGVAVMMLDIDHFKDVNDSMGHHAGDLLLESVSSRLKSCLRGSDFVARFGGDEFVLALPGVGEEHHVHQIAGSVLSVLVDPFCVQNRQLRVNASIGIAQYPRNGHTPEDLLRSADQAMYSAKANGRGQFCFSTNDPAADQRLAPLCNENA